ncbi:TPA: hypothetical protein EYP66_05205 [Candidatus Poribacteria bacterium]|nr:hypothetical protein [Candidatus Poribacteria bacterium]
MEGKDGKEVEEWGEKMMNCRRSKKLIVKYSGSLRDGLKEDKKLAELEEHLSVCSECHRKLVSLERTERLLFAIPLKEPPDGLWDGLKTRIVAEEAASEDRRRKVKDGRILPIPRYSFVAIAASAILLISIGFFFLRPFSSQESISPGTTSDGLSSIYVEQHALRAWRDPLADRARLGWSVQLTIEDTERLASP